MVESRSSRIIVPFSGNYRVAAFGCQLLTSVFIARGKHSNGQAGNENMGMNAIAHRSVQKIRGILISHAS